jgi:hypothetical protein
MYVHTYVGAIRMNHHLTDVRRSICSTSFCQLTFHLQTFHQLCHRIGQKVQTNDAVYLGSLLFMIINFCDF